MRAQGMEPELLIAFAQDKQFFTAPAREVLMAYENLLLETLRPHATGTLVELGCGLGDKLLRMAERLKPKTVFGGEFTRSGVECGRLLAKLFRINAQFEQFDYNNPATLEAVPEHAMVFTSHSIEQIPNLPERFIAGLIRRSPRVVLHFEPDYEGHDRCVWHQSIQLHFSFHLAASLNCRKYFPRRPATRTCSAAVQCLDCSHPRVLSGPWFDAT